MNKGYRYQTLFLLSLISLVIISCAPKTFIRTMDPGWNAVEVREDLTFDVAWKSIVDLIARKFDIEVISKEDGYFRTGWLYTWTGKLDEYYKVRAIIKFKPDKRVVEIKSEAQHFAPGFLGIGRGWEMGTDELLTTTLRSDIMGKVGRTTR
jgi:hypothetical protein